jgi:hypothetical protein
MALSGNYQYVPSVSATKSAETILNAGVVGSIPAGIGGMNSTSLAPNGSNMDTAIPSGLGGNGTADGKVLPGAVPAKTGLEPVVVTGSRIDNRVRIKVPSEYNSSKFTTSGKKQNGIIFPYTPQITMEHTADYSKLTPMHSNYSFNFYKNSSVSDISIQGVFTVQNDKDAMALLSTIHLLRSLTKGRFGYNDALRGAPPPICKLMAYGNYMLDNVPISIASFKQDLTSEVDYYRLYSDAMGNPFGEAMVPIKCTLSIVCKLMYSREETSKSTVPNWLSGVSRKKGLL